MFVIKFLIVAAIMYIVLTIAIPACIGAYYGSKLWKKYATLQSIFSQDTLNQMFQYDVQMRVINHPYMKFLSKF